jgi:F0F1-type ATP synthase, epsilon subunit (mitochondrial delta subunit)
LSSIEIGELNFTKDGQKSYYAVNTGYAEVTSNKVTILIETAERSDSIDKDRARKAKEVAEASLAQLTKEDNEYEKVHLALLRAIVRISVAEK